MDSRINAAWHKTHPMPKNATTDQRIKWHLSHIKNCKCRNDIPSKLKEEMLKRGLAIPVQAD